METQLIRERTRRFREAAEGGPSYSTYAYKGLDAHAKPGLHAFVADIAQQRFPAGAQLLDCAQHEGGYIVNCADQAGLKHKAAQEKLEHTLLPKVLALPVFASDVFHGGSGTYGALAACLGAGRHHGDRRDLRRAGEFHHPRHHHHAGNVLAVGRKTGAAAGGRTCPGSFLITERKLTMRQFNGPPPEGQKIQQVVEPGSVDEIGQASMITVWGKKTGDRFIADILVYSLPDFATK